MTKILRCCMSRVSTRPADPTAPQKPARSTTTTKRLVQSMPPKGLQVASCDLIHSSYAAADSTESKTPTEQSTSIKVTVSSNVTTDVPKPHTEKPGETKKRKTRKRCDEEAKVKKEKEAQQDARRLVHRAISIRSGSLKLRTAPRLRSSEDLRTISIVALPCPVIDASMRRSSTSIGKIPCHRVEASQGNLHPQ